MTFKEGKNAPLGYKNLFSLYAFPLFLNERLMTAILPGLLRQRPDK